MFKEIKNIYRTTLNEKDNFWTRIISRPFASIIVYLIKDTYLKPNHITIISYFVTVVSGFIFIFYKTHGGLIVAALIYQFGYVLDCVDGQLVRMRNIQSKSGYWIDFLFDGAKALIIVACVSLRLFFIHQNSSYLILGIIGIVLVATSLLLTWFTRTEEYLKLVERIKNYPSPSNTAPVDKGTNKLPSLRDAVKILEKVGKFLIHYPSYIIYFALFNKIEWFFYIYVGIYVLYTLKIFLSTAWVISKN